jgi:hypothetical protein
MRFLAPLAIATATAFTAYALPARANPGPSVNLVRISGDGVTPLPNVVDAIESLNKQEPRKILLSQAGAPGQVQLPELETIYETFAQYQDREDFATLRSGQQDFRIEFAAPLPTGLSGTILIQDVVDEDPFTVETVETISFSDVQFSDDRTEMIIPHDRRLPTGDTWCVTFPDEVAGQLPRRTSPRCFEVRRAVAWWVPVLVIGAAVGIGLAISGGGDDDGGPEPGPGPAPVPSR